MMLTNIAAMHAVNALWAVLCALVTFSVAYDARIYPAMSLTGCNSHMRKFWCSLAVASLQFHTPCVLADSNSIDPNTIVSSGSVKQVPLLVKRSSDVQQYVDLGRGFKLLRPFGFNEFQGSGGGYAVKFASLFEVDENVVVGNVPAHADKTSIADFGTLESLGDKLLKKRGDGARLVSASARETEGTLFYEYQFDNPLDASLPRTGPRDKRPSRGVELYELCVAKGRLWSVQATSNDRLFPRSEQVLRAALASFLPRL